MVNHEPSTSDAASTSLDPSRSDVGLPEAAEQSTDLDDVFAALKHPRRRYLLSALTDRDGEQPLARLATDVAAWEADSPRAAVSAEARERCRVALHHVHVPKLAALGVVDYDPDGEPTVRAADTGDVTAVLDSLAGELDTDGGTLRQRDGA